MNGQRLRISLRTGDGTESTPPALSLSCDAYAQHLRDARFEVIELAGLATMGARAESGVSVDRLELRVDSEAEMLALACAELGHLVPRETPQKHEVYLDDGQFEITALLAGDEVVLRAGVYSDPFDPQDPGNTRMSRARYFGIWCAVAAALEEPLATAQGHREPLSWADRLDRLDHLARRALDQGEAHARAGQSNADIDELVALLEEVGRDQALPNSPKEAADTLHRLAALFDEMAKGSHSAQPVATAIRRLGELIADAPPSASGTDALTRLLPPSSGRARESDAERTERLYRTAREDIARSMREFGIDDD